MPFSPNEDLDHNGMLKIADQDGHFFPVAITGMGVRMPAAQGVPGFLETMEKELCGIIPIPPNRWHQDDYYHRDTHMKGHMAIPKLGFCEKYYHFDAGYFNMSPKEAMFTDPQHRQALEITDEALQDAGYLPENIPKDTGVYFGMGIIDIPIAYLENRNFYNGHTLHGSAHSCAPNRISHHYGFTGPSIVVDTACAASLTAIHVACMSLWNKENSLAIAGATSNVYTPETTLAFSQLGVLSPTGNSAPFDHTNNGYVRSEGTGVVILKKLDEAIRDGDHVYCVVRASTSAHNGFSMSLTLPSTDGQEALIRRCYDSFGIPMEKVNFVEAHGTGTPVGDPLETKALGNTFGRAKKEPLLIQSAKSNFGHLEVAAGMVQVVKAALMLEKRKYFKQIKWTKPNPRIDFEALNLMIQPREEPYTKQEKFLIGINTFGFGGSLVHMVFEEFRARMKTLPDKVKAGWSFGEDAREGRLIAVPLSAKNLVALRNTAQAWLGFQDDKDAQAVTSWLATRRRHFREKRLVVLAKSGADFRSKLSAWLEGSAAEGASSGLLQGALPASHQAPKVCMVFPGWKQQWLDMGRDLYKNEPVFTKAVDECDAVYKALSGQSALEQFKIFVDKKGEAMDPASIDGAACKPAILFLQIGLHKLLGHWGVKPDMVMGLGLGEQVAAYAAGALSLEKTIEIMILRMSSPPKDQFLDAMKQVVNGPRATSAQFYSSTLGAKHSGAMDADYWWKNVSERPDVQKTVGAILEENPNTVFVEVSASALVSPLIQKMNPALQTVTCGERDQDSWMTTLEAISRLHLLGCPVNWAALTRGCASYAPIPIYGWDDRFYRLETKEYIGRRQGLVDRSFRAMDGVISHDWMDHLRDYRMGGETLFGAAAAIEYMLEYDEAVHATLKDVSIHGTAVVPPIRDIDGFVNTIDIKVQQDKARLSVVAEKTSLLAQGSLAFARPHTQQPAINLTDLKVKVNAKVSEDVAQMYERFEDLGLCYGEEHRHITELYSGDMEALAFCSGSKSGNRHERLATVVLEAAFQTAVHAFTDGRGLYLPKTVGLLEMFVDKVPAQTPFAVHAILKDVDLKSVTSDLTICDTMGKVWATVENFRADSTVEFATDVELSRCLYTTKWQSIKSEMPATSAVEDRTVKNDEQDQSSSDMADKLRPLVSAYAVEALTSVPEAEVSPEAAGLVAQLKGLAELADDDTASELVVTELLDTHPELSFEVHCLSEIGTSLPEQLRKPPTEKTIHPKAAEFLTESSLLAGSLSQITTAIQTGVLAALKEKSVVRVCEVGGQTAALAKPVVQALAEQIQDKRVEYVFTDVTDNHFEAVNDVLGEDSLVKFQVLDPAALSEDQKGSFDVAICLDLQKTTCQSDVTQLLAEDGWLMTVTNASKNFLFQFLTLSQTEGAAVIGRHLEKSALSDLRTVPGEQQGLLTATLGKKPSVVQPTSGGNNTATPSVVVIHNGEAAMAGLLKDKLRGDVAVYEASAFLATEDTCLHQKEEGKKVHVIYLIGEGPSVMVNTLHVVAVLRGIPSAASDLQIWGVLHKQPLGQDCDNARACAGVLSAFAGDRDVSFRILDVDSCDAAIVTSSISRVLHTAPLCHAEVAVTSGNDVMVSRVTPLDVTPMMEGPEAWRAHEVVINAGHSLQYQGVRLGQLKPGEVRVRVKATAKDNLSEGSVMAFAGVVEEAGPGVQGATPGTAVMGMERSAITSHVVTARTALELKPNHLSWSEAASSLMSYTTAYHALVEQAEVGPGETVLVHPARGPLAQAAARLARVKGARVITTYDNSSDLPLLARDLGVVLLANPNAPGFKADIQGYTNGSGIDVVIQIQTDELPKSCVECLAFGGRVVKIGSRFNVSAVANVRHMATDVTSLMRRRACKVRNIVKAVATHLQEGAVQTTKPAVRDVTSLSDDVIAMRAMADTYEIPDEYEPLLKRGAEVELRSDVTYLVTGGHGRMGREVVRWLADRGAGHIAAVSTEGGSTCAYKATKRYAQRQGATVYDIHQDVSLLPGVKAIFKDLAGQGAPQVGGVFHLAGHTTDLTDNSPDNVIQMIRSQVTGARHLHEVTRELKTDLDHFVLFSSFLGSLGGSGLAGLAGVSAACQALAEERQAQGLSALCLQLGLVRGVGAVDDNPSLTTRLQDIGMTSLHFHEYLATLSSLLTQRHLPATVVITNQMWSTTVSSLPTQTTKCGHLSTENGLNKGAGGVDARQLLEARVSRYVGELTGADPDDIELEAPMSQYGVDSLMSQDLIAWSLAQFKLTLEQTEIFGGLTINNLINRILS